MRTPGAGIHPTHPISMNSRNLPSFLRPLAVSWLLASVSVASAQSFIGEPETLVYGRILNRANPNAEQLITGGQLLWTIQKPDGTTIVLSGEVDKLGGGNYSYLLRIPHQAVMLGQQPQPGTLPLGIVPTAASHMTITLDDAVAEIMPPATSRLDLDQILRATTWRMDLQISTAAEDTDGDGMADWWEDLHGLDKQNANDALTDLNGNGISNYAEFLAGNDPAQDSRLPMLLTREIIAYAASTSIVVLETADSDSAPPQLVYTLRSVPEGGRLMLRNTSPLPQQTAAELVAGSMFTQADVNSGRLVFVHTPGGTPAYFEVAVRDEDPAHPESSGSVMVRMFDPAPGMAAANANEGMRMEALRLASENGHLIADLAADDGIHRLSAPSAGMTSSAYQAHAAAYGPDAPHILLGGPSDDVLTGGHANDFLHGGEGADTMTGGAGADTFLFTGVSAKSQTVTDFNAAAGDVIDLAGVLDGASQLLTQYVRIRRSGADALLEISAAGTGSGFTDRVIRLANSSLQPADVANLHYSGNLETGDIGLPPRLGIVATAPMASENGPMDGVFTITREGDPGVPLEVGLLITGNATNGADYQFLPPAITIPEGETMVNIAVRPYVDAFVEFNEVVRIGLTSSPSYLLAANASADLVIEDLKPQIRLEVLEELASVSGPMPGSVLMRRSGLVSTEVFVQFTLAGTAVNNVDYNYITPYVSLAAGQTTKLIEFMPKSTVNFGTAEAKTIRMTVKPDSAYAVLEPVANLLVVPERLTYETWIASAETLGAAVAAASSPEGGEAQSLMRYGFSKDPRPAFDGQMRERLPKVSIEDGYLTMRFRRKPGVTDLRYQVEYSNDLRVWSGTATDIEDITSRVAPDDPGASVFRAKRRISEAPVAAMRVRLTLEGDSNNN